MNLEIIEEQQFVIDSKEQTILVTARPGRGKTTVALLTASRIIKDKEIAPSQSILFLTFSRNAVYQIEQAGDLILDKEIKNHLWVSTYHAFMWWVLTTFGRYHNLPTNLSVMQETKNRAVRNSATLISIQQSDLPFYLAKNYSAIAYDDFSPLTLSLLSNSQSLRSIIQDRFPIIIVDEFQDTNQEQWELIRFLSENSRLVCFADPDQMIFRWRGASDDRLKQLVSERKAKEYKLQNKCKRTDDNSLLDFSEAILDNNNGGAGERRVWKNRFLTAYPYPNSLGYHLKMQIRSFYADFQKRKPNKEYPTIAIAAYSNNNAKLIQNVLAKSTPKAPKTYNCNLLEGQTDDVIEELIICLTTWAVGGSINQLLQAIKLIGGLLISDISKANNSLITLLSPEKLVSREIKPKGIAKDVLEIFESIPRPINDPTEAISKSVSAVTELMKRKAIENVINTDVLNSAQLKILKVLDVVSMKSALEAINLVQSKLSSEKIQTEILDRIMPIKGIISSTLHKLKGREFDYICIVTQAGDKLRNKDDYESDARKLLYVALTRARYDARILYSESDPCPLLIPFLR